MQKKLDTYIEENHQLQEKNLFDDKILALLVEMGELANETRCFKFWSTQTEVDEEAILEEYVDGIHFLLSLGLEKNFLFESLDVGSQSFTLTEQFNEVYRLASLFKEKTTMENYKLLFMNYVQLGDLLGFTPADIEKAYLEKNEVNFNRQDEGY